jgi:hypothetical protein
MAASMDDASEGYEYDFPDELELSRTVSEPLLDAEVTSRLHLPPHPIYRFPISRTEILQRTAR